MKKYFALLLCLAMLFGFAACGEKETENVTTEAEITSETKTAPASEATSDEATAEATEATAESTTESTTEATTESTTEATTVTTTTAKATTTKKVTTTKKATTTKKVTTTKEDVKAPTSKADILALYNGATKKASSSKPGYSKTTKAALQNLSMGALAKIGVVRGAVGDFLGEGTNSATVSKGKFDGKSLMVSSLKESDITKATCELSGDKKTYTVKLTVKGETNPLKNKSALGSFTSDYKDAEEIRQGLVDGNAKVDEITVKTTSVTITAKIDAKTSQFKALDYAIRMSAVLTNIKYSIAKVSKATTDLNIDVSFKDFKY